MMRRRLAVAKAMDLVRKRPEGRPDTRRVKSIPSLRSADDAQVAEEYRALFAQRLAYLVPVEEPLVLISQIQRSGGTLLMRLFDGHPECHTVPHELSRMVGGLETLERGESTPWVALTPLRQADRLDSGFRGFRQKGPGRDDPTHAFLLPPSLQRGLLESVLAETESPPTRRIANAYMTSYFNAWLDNANLRATPKRWVVGFEPGFIESEPAFDAYRRTYPDGRVISIVRDPWSWFSSARAYRQWRGQEAAVESWCVATELALKRQTESPGSVALILFDDLLRETEKVVRWLADWLGISFTPALLEATFNGVPIVANTSFTDVDAAVSTAPIERRSDLTEDEVAFIDAQAGPLYRRAADSAVTI
jgi:hypothetical protein